MAQLSGSRLRNRIAPPIPAEPWEMSVLNGVLRAYFRVGEYNEIEFEDYPNHFFYQYPDPEDRWEIDHFFEIQHVVRIVWELVGINWQQRPTVQYMDLSSFLNDYRNMYRIPRAANQRKKSVRFDNRWLHDHLIQAYLACKVQDTGGQSVSDLLKSLTREMRNRPGQNAELTRFVGEKLAQGIAA
ncbi:hypothetical protein AAE478_001037 [Parahypoxylon ruwenzoriense]